MPRGSIFSAMIYAPLAAYLVEASPARLRYTSASLAYQIGNGVFGGLLPVIGVSLCASGGNIYAGLVYPIAISALTFVVGSLFLGRVRSAARRKVDTAGCGADSGCKRLAAGWRLAGRAPAPIK